MAKHRLPLRYLTPSGDHLFVPSGVFRANDIAVTLVNQIAHLLLTKKLQRSLNKTQLMRILPIIHALGNFPNAYDGDDQFLEFISPPGTNQSGVEELRLLIRVKPRVIQICHEPLPAEAGAEPEGPLAPDPAYDPREAIDLRFSAWEGDPPLQVSQDLGRRLLHQVIEAITQEWHLHIDGLSHCAKTPRFFDRPHRLIDLSNRDRSRNSWMWSLRDSARVISPNSRFHKCLAKPPFGLWI